MLLFDIRLEKSFCFLKSQEYTLTSEILNSDMLHVNTHLVVSSVVCITEVLSIETHYRNLIEYTFVHIILSLFNPRYFPLFSSLSSSWDTM